MPCHAMPCHAMQRYPLRLPACPAQILGLGRTGHIGFNEKGSSRASATRLITLDRATRVDAASDFFGESNVPRRAITMGRAPSRTWLPSIVQVATILASRRIILMAFGENKAAIVRQAVEGPVSEQVAASYLQEHPDAVAFLDYAAAAGLTRVQCPWVLGPIQWTDTQVKKAVVWLAQQVGKPLLKLTDDDYNEHSLQDLLAEQGPSYDINLRVFYDLQRTITGWPGGRPPGMKGRGRNAAQHKRHSGAAHAGTEAGVAGSAAAAGSCKAAGQGGLGAARGSSSGQEGEIKAHREDDSESRASFGGSGDGAEAADGPPPPCIQLRRQYTDQGDSMAAATPKSSVFPKRILVMSPHPDDDVISMGGTLIRMIDQGHEVHVAYQTSGEIAVWDADAVRFADFAVQFGAAMGLSDNERTSAIARKIESALHNKQPGEVDSPEVLRIKSLIRRCEARSGKLLTAGRTCGADVRNLHFLDMPFYSTGKVVKDPLSQRDIDIVVDLLHQIYAAGDLSDPHGTHRTCLQAIFEALDTVRHRDWYTACSTEVFLYRGAWQEWEPWEADMVVPLSPGELQQKVDAIFKHQSQDRNRATAALFDRLGLAEYEAMEAFVRYDPGAPSSLFKTPCADSRREKAALKGGELRGL
ncbi:hypothetical protein COHA_009375 [Chlorella ohadii]|uniref:N-acetylglucosaminylphosphatidylinositol deacetylase n=1 Tax=Chlorella ohadii TaxID=2649997 RepID=A0AAD5H2A2_9CHLO|nr:hypothetical protein COHA_009375 [Chlorella ohadii]